MVQSGRYYHDMGVPGEYVKNRRCYRYCIGVAQDILDGYVRGD